MIGDVHIPDRGAIGTVRGDHHRIHKASIFELFKSSKADRQLTTLVTAPDVSSLSFDHQTKRPPRVYGARAHYRIVFKEKGMSLHSLSCLRRIKVPLVVQSILEILEGNAILSYGESF
jgi:hypothetical protein